MSLEDSDAASTIESGRLLNAACFPTWFCEGRENLTVESLVTVANTLKVRVPALLEPPTEGQERASKVALDQVTVIR
jgi:hypothetical protein